MSIPKANHLAVDIRAAIKTRGGHRTLPRHRRGERFLKGPIPWRWIQAAARLPGHALHIGIILWQKAGYEDSPNVKFCLASASDLGVQVATARRGVRQLERAGLITVRRKPGCGLTVTIKEPLAEIPSSDAKIIIPRPCRTQSNILLQ